MIKKMGFVLGFGVPYLTWLITGSITAELAALVGLLVGFGWGAYVAYRP